MRLDFGSGDIRTEGYTSVDISEKCHPDYVWDIRKIPYPKEWEGCEEVRADNILEHLLPEELIAVTNEVNRIMKPGGKFWIRVPLLKLDAEHLDGAFTDPTHRNYFTMGSFDYWDIDHPRYKSYGKDYGIIPWKRIRNEDYPPKFLIVELIKL
jgi:predicted SAM-dependent methyltransferase